MPVEGERHAGFPRMPRDGQQEHLVRGVGADAGPSCTLVVPFDHASDGAVDSEQPEARRGLAFEPDAPPSPEGVRIGVLPGQPRCEGPELAAASSALDLRAPRRSSNCDLEPVMHAEAAAAPPAPTGPARLSPPKAGDEALAASAPHLESPAAANGIVAAAAAQRSLPV